MKVKLSEEENEFEIGDLKPERQTEGKKVKRLFWENEIVGYYSTADRITLLHTFSFF